MKMWQYAKLAYQWQLMAAKAESVQPANYNSYRRHRRGGYGNQLKAHLAAAGIAWLWRNSRRGWRRQSALRRIRSG